MQKEAVKYNEGLMKFLAASPTPLHAVREIAAELEANRFKELREGDSWTLEKGGRYFVRREGAIAAFVVSKGSPADEGFRLVGAHSDSPALKIKPNPEIEVAGYLKLGVEVYGGALLAPWFDRDLSIAGRVSYVTGENRVKSALIDFERPVAVIPSLAIHLCRDVNEQRSINKQAELPALVLQVGAGAEAKDRDFRVILLEELRRTGVTDAVRVLEHDLLLYDTQPPAVVGLRGDFLASARFDNLLSCYVGLTALCQSSDTGPTRVLVCNDHEEVGSATHSGAEGPFLKSILGRIAGGEEALARAIDRSFLVSADNAHGVHPNYADKHDGRHGPILNRGPVIKINANQRYATTGETASLFAWLCDRAEVPSQRFVTRSDMACGSTIGPITATVLGVRTVDVGLPTFAMHSTRELAGARDPHLLHRALVRFYSEAKLGG